MSQLCLGYTDRGVKWGVRKWEESMMSPSFQTSSTGWLAVSLRDGEYRCDDCKHSHPFPFLPSRGGIYHPVLKSRLTMWLEANGTLANVTPQRPEKYLWILVCSLKNLEPSCYPENNSRIPCTHEERTKWVAIPTNSFMKHPRWLTCQLADTWTNQNRPELSSRVKTHCQTAEFWAKWLVVVLNHSYLGFVLVTFHVTKCNKLSNLVT